MNPEIESDLIFSKIFHLQEELYQQNYELLNFVHEILFPNWPKTLHSMLILDNSNQILQSLLSFCYLTKLEHCISNFDQTQHFNLKVDSLQKSQSTDYFDLFLNDLLLSFFFFFFFWFNFSLKFKYLFISISKNFIDVRTTHIKKVGHFFQDKNLLQFLFNLFFSEERTEQLRLSILFDLCQSKLKFEDQEKRPKKKLRIQEEIVSQPPIFDSNLSIMDLKSVIDSNEIKVLQSFISELEFRITSKPLLSKVPFFLHFLHCFFFID